MHGHKACLEADGVPQEARHSCTDTGLCSDEQLLYALRAAVVVDQANSSGSNTDTSTDLLSCKVMRLAAACMAARD